MTRKASGGPLQKRIHDLRPFLADLRFALDGEDDPDDPDDPDDEVDTGASGTGTDDVDKDVKDPDRKRLHEEAKQHRLAAKQAKRERDELAAELQAIKDKDKPEIERLSTENESLKARLAERDKQIRETAIRLAFYETGVAGQFREGAVAMRLLDLKDIEVDEDGLVDNDKIKTLADALLKSHPYLAADGSDGSGSTKDQSGGTPSNGRKTKAKDDAALVKKFPALASRG